MDRLSLIPGDVRGDDNIVTTKTSFANDENIGSYHASVTESSQTINGMTLRAGELVNHNDLNVSLNAPRFVSGSSASVTVSCVSSGSLSSAATVVLQLRDVDGEVLWSGSDTTTSTKTFSVTLPDGVVNGVWWCKVSHSTLGNVVLHKSFVVGSVDSLTLTGTSGIVQSGDVSYLIGTLSGHNGDLVMGIPGQTVSFYEGYTPSLDLRAVPSIIQSGETSTLTGLFKDSDGSIIRQSGVSVSFYEEYTPSLWVGASPNIIQSSESSSLKAMFKDSDGSIVRQSGNSVSVYGDFNSFTDDCTGSSLSPFYNKTTGTVQYTTYSSDNVLKLGTSSGSGRIEIKVSELSGFTFECDVLTKQGGPFVVYCADSNAAPLIRNNKMMGADINGPITLLNCNLIDVSSFYHFKLEVDGNNGKATYNGNEVTSTLFDLTDMRTLVIDASSICYLKNIKYNEEKR